MKYLVKHTPIRKDKKTYGVGEEYPYSDKDKSLLQKGYLKEVKDEQQVAPKTRPAVIKKTTAKKKTTKKGQSK